MTSRSHGGTSPGEAKQTPLMAAHVELGAKLTDFAGWRLPLRYPRGTTKEHLGTREAVGVFDVSHLGRIEVQGEGSLALLQFAFTNDLEKIGPQKAQYTLLLNDAGGVVDDIIVLWLAPDRFLVVPNAANTEVVYETLLTIRDSGILGSSVAPRIEDITSRTAMIAVQGPLWKEVCRECGVGDLPPRLGVVGSPEIIVAGTGYTGEAGAELIVPAERGADIFLALVDKASRVGGGPCGLGARDTLRLEMGYPLWGNEMDESISPFEASLGWAVATGKEDFKGKGAALERSASPRWKLEGVVMNDDGAIPRSGYSVGWDGETGVVTSGGFSPTLQKGIALCRLPAGVKEEAGNVVVDIRGRRAEGRLVKPPFVRTALT